MHQSSVYGLKGLVLLGVGATKRENCIFYEYHGGKIAKKQKTSLDPASHWTGQIGLVLERADMMYMYMRLYYG